jgi:hypothetical protein
MLAKKAQATRLVLGSHARRLWAPAADSDGGAALRGEEGQGEDAEAHPELAGEVFLADGGHTVANLEAAASGIYREVAVSGGISRRPGPIPSAQSKGGTRRSPRAAWRSLGKPQMMAVAGGHGGLGFRCLRVTESEREGAREEEREGE